jgi:excisionase family DNA binding protein
MPWLTTEEAAEILNYHPEYVRHLLRSERLRWRKFGVVWFVDLESVNALRELLDQQNKQGYARNDPRRGRE